ncbi:hypothetical protein DYB32_002062 [Aphanomyces invadans]|nr:hypothetical protein DYB32_002062 [Aphanomyces invadans]
MTITAANRSTTAASISFPHEHKTVTAGKAIEEFRNYKDSNRQAMVQRHYRLMRENQTMEFHEKMQSFWGKFDRVQMTVWEAFESLKGYVDSSDPDSSLPNLEHMLQTAEAIRAAGHPDWFQLVGLLHDMGKIQYMWGKPEDGQEGTADGDQWSLGGDTWVVGCAIPDTTVFPEFNALNPDMQNPAYNTPFGIYEPKCGFANLKFAWGHDEYMYQMLVFNGATIPEEGLAMIRYHSCYPWHNKKEYTHLMAPGDDALLEWVLEFNKFDLYTKADKRPDVSALWPYYQGLIDKYMPGKLWW